MFLYLSYLWLRLKGERKRLKYGVGAMFSFYPQGEVWGTFKIHFWGSTLEERTSFILLTDTFRSSSHICEDEKVKRERNWGYG